MLRFLCYGCKRTVFPSKLISILKLLYLSEEGKKLRKHLKIFFYEDKDCDFLNCLDCSAENIRRMGHYSMCSTITNTPIAVYVS